MPKISAHAKRARATGKRPRAPETPVRRLKKIKSLSFDMEEPLTDALNYVRALGLIGSGMAAHYDDTGEPIAAIARAAAGRLDDLKKAWEGMLKV